MTRSSPPLGVMVVGAGDMGARHVKHWTSTGARVTAICDPDTARAEALARPLGATVCTEPEACLTRQDVHIVSVCTPTFLHAEVTVAALEAGKHVLCEKPAALTLADAEAMKRAAEVNRCELRIGFMRRFDPAYDQLLSFYARIGTPVLAQATIAAGIRPKLLMHDAHANGGPVIDMCCHIFHLWSTIFGCQPELVSAHGYTFSANKTELKSVTYKALDSAHMTLEYPSGTVGQVQVSWGLPSGIDATEHHTYMGPDGLLNVNWNRLMTLRDASGTTRWSSSGADPWQREIEHFYRELTEDAPRRVASIDDGIAALRVSLAVLESVAEKKPIRPEAVNGEAPPAPQGVL